MRRLDDVVAGRDLRKQLIEIDVQGFEDRVILGCLGTIQRAKILIVETSFELLYNERAIFDDVYTSAAMVDRFSSRANSFQRLDCEAPRALRIVQTTSLVIATCVSFFCVTLCHAEQANAPWVATAKIFRDGKPNGSGVYLKSGLIITAAHLTSANAEMAVQMAGVSMPATVVKQGVYEEIDLTLLSIDEGKLPARLTVPEVPLCAAPPWPGDPVIVIDSGAATRSYIISPEEVPFAVRRFSTLIRHVTTTGQSGSGVFDPKHKCLHGIMSRALMAGDKPLAKYFVPASDIRKFMPKK